MILSNGPTLLVLAVFFTNVKSENIKSSRESSAKRHSRHIPPQQPFELWTESNLNIIFPPQLNFFKPPLDHPSNFEHNKVDNFDPHLVTGPEAKHIAECLYRRAIFFGEIPHDKLLYENQRLRKINGLSENFISSIRYNSPFPTIRFGRRQ